ncbi:MAG: hypothetical protein ACJAU9_000015 [Lentimonas sp.]|jgi:hypothetical protein
MKTHFTLYLIIAFCGGYLPKIYAQHTDSEPLLDLDFQVYIWPHGSASSNKDSNIKSDYEGDLLPKYMDNEIGLLQGNQVSLVSTDKARLSASFHYIGPGPMRFVDYDAVPTEDQIPTIIAEVNPPSSMKQGLFIFFPVSNEALKYRILAVDTSRTKLSIGSSIVHNLTPSNIAIKIGNEQMHMKSMQNEKVATNQLRDSQLPIQIAVESEQSDQWILRYSTRKIIQQDSRLIFIIYNPQGNKSLYRILTLNADH